MAFRREIVEGLTLMGFFLEDFPKKSGFFPDSMKVVTLLKVFFEMFNNLSVDKFIGCTNSIFNSLCR